LLPQVLLNIRDGNVQNQSIWLWILWLLGDACNVAGCILSNQLPSQLGVAVIYGSITLVLFLQYLWYKHWSQKKAVIMDALEDEATDLTSSPAIGIRSSIAVRSPRLISRSELRKEEAEASADLEENLIWTSPESRKGKRRNSLHALTWIPILVLFIWDQVSDLGTERKLLWKARNPSIASRYLGYALGCLMTCFYLSARIPQIYKMVSTGVATGVSNTMFILTFSANLTYCLSIFVRSLDAKYLLDKLPWLVDAIGTMVQDSAILYIAHRFRQKKKIKKQLPEENEPFIQQVEKN
jgi:hypothetical protein